MSIGPPALGNILVQRLDAVLGTSMAAYANLINGARPDAVPPTGEAGRNGQLELDENGQPIAADAEGDTARQIADAKTAVALSLAARGLITSTELTASAPTTLGQTARTILALLAQSPDKAPSSQGRVPLWSDPAEAEAEPGTPQAASNGQAAAGAAGIAGQAQTVGQSTQSAQAAQQPAAPPGETPGQAGPARPGQAPLAATNQAAASQSTAAAQGPQPAQFIQALRAALQQTGLFYESHLTQMVFGQRTPAQLAGEPQAKLDQNAVIARDTPTQTNSPATLAPNASWGSAAGLTATQNAPGSLLNTPGGASGNSATSLNLSSALGADNSNPLAGIHPDATTLVRQQLDVLANQALAWQGQAWPGVEMEWEVERDRSQGGEIIDDTHWATRLQLELPRLGLVQARLNLSGNQVILSLVAPSSAGELNQNSEALRHRFAAAGLTLSQLSVDAQPPSPFDLP